MDLPSGSMQQIYVTFTGQFPVSLPRGMWPQNKRLAQQKERSSIEAEMMTIGILVVIVMVSENECQNSMSSLCSLKTKLGWKEKLRDRGDDVLIYAIYHSQTVLINNHMSSLFFIPHSVRDKQFGANRACTPRKEASFAGNFLILDAYQWISA